MTGDEPDALREIVLRTLDMAFPPIFSENLPQNVEEQKGVAQPSYIILSSATPFRIAMEMHPLHIIKTKTATITLDLLTTEEGDSDLKESAILHTSTYKECKEVEVSDPFKKIADGHAKISDSYHKLGCLTIDGKVSDAEVP